jgi:hypothetical protein
MTLEEIYLKAAKIDPSFARSLLDSNQPKQSVASHLLCLKSQKRVGPLKTKQTCEETL